jgi:hypothetical protein
MRDTETGWQSVRCLEATTPTPLLVLDRPGTSPENMALRALLEKLDDKIALDSFEANGALKTRLPQSYR